MQPGDVEERSIDQWCLYPLGARSGVCARCSTDSAVRLCISHKGHGLRCALTSRCRGPDVPPLLILSVQPHPRACHRRRLSLCCCGAKLQSHSRPHPALPLPRLPYAQCPRQTPASEQGAPPPPPWEGCSAHGSGAHHPSPPSAARSPRGAPTTCGGQAPRTSAPHELDQGCTARARRISPAAPNGGRVAQSLTRCCTQRATHTRWRPSASNHQIALRSSRRRRRSACCWVRGVEQSREMAMLFPPCAHWPTASRAPAATSCTHPQSCQPF